MTHALDSALKKYIKIEKEWLDNLSNRLTKYCGEVLKNYIMEGAPDDPDDPDEQENLSEFTFNAIQKMNMLLTIKVREQVIFDKAHISSSKFDYMKKIFRETKDIDRIYQLMVDLSRQELQQKNVPQNFKDLILQNGWGLAGKKEKDKILITLIPDEIETYFSTVEEKKKRAAYCHCPRIKKILAENGQTKPSTYCIWKAGFYKGLWRDLTDSDVQVNINETVLDGALTCSFSIKIED